MSTNPSPQTVHLVSDATGETLNVLTRAVSAQFPDILLKERLHALVRTKRQMNRVVRAIQDEPGLVMSTIMDAELSAILQDATRAMGVMIVTPLDPIIAAFRTQYGREALSRPGAQHELDTDYFNRIDALNFTMAHDDGAMPEELIHADVVLVGVSRTSKTPTSIYLANRGVKVANIPLVPGRDPPPALFKAEKPLIVGLTAAPERIIDVRRNRLRSMADDGQFDYADDDAVEQELLMARRLFSKHQWPVIDVTRKSIEETSATILDLLRKHRK